MEEEWIKYGQLQQFPTPKVAFVHALVLRWAILRVEACSSKH